MLSTRTKNPHEVATTRLLDPQVPVRLKLSALWVSVMFLYVYVDIFSFYKPGTIDDILVGRVWQFDITQGWALSALALMTVPSLMVVLSLALPSQAARWANVVVASLYVLVSIFNIVGETWTYLWLGMAIESLLLLFVVRYAWTWPNVAAEAGSAVRPVVAATS